MRTGLIVSGIVLLAAGIWVAIGNGSYRQTDTLVQLGTARITATHEKPVPPWLGIAAIVLGGVLVIGGLARKR